MIISHRYKYLFVELPLTGSTAISKELITTYGGERILSKHATYSDFLKIATEEEKHYFVFSCIRNPMDRAVSHYYKYKTNHKEQFTSQDRLRKRKGFYQKINKFVDLSRYKYIQRNHADFAQYFNHFYRVPYDNWSSLHHKAFDAVIRFEFIQEDFSKVLQSLGIEPVRPLPLANKTNKAVKDFSECYPVEIRQKAIRIFGPFMQQWGYQFPPDWGCVKVSRLSKVEYAMLGYLRRFIWWYMR